MTDAFDSAYESASNGESNLVSQFITDVAADALAPSLPAPVKRNIFKAFGQLFSAAIDIPTAHLEGLADEKRAETEARLDLIQAATAQVARQMGVDPEYGRVASHKYAQRILREQLNLDRICEEALIDIRDKKDAIDKSGQEETRSTISKDWLNAFETDGRQKSSAEMQAYFGRILSGEIQHPGSFSTRTIKILASLDQEIASHFARLCSMCMSINGDDFRVTSLGGNAALNSLAEHGLSFETLNLLNEWGLVISEYRSEIEFVPCLGVYGTRQKGHCRPFSFQGRQWVLKPMCITVIGKPISIEGVALTRAGRELFEIVKVEPVDKYLQELANFFKRMGYQMVESEGLQLVDVEVNDTTE